VSLPLDSRIFIAGHLGMVGSALVRALRARGHERLLLRSRSELDLRDQGATRAFLGHERPDIVVVAAGTVGGIRANDELRADFLADNLQIATNLIEGAHRAGIDRLLFFASNCIYPRACPQPMAEEMLWTGPLEPTNQPYAVAKLAGVELCDAFSRQHGRNYFAVMPASLYGPNDNYDPNRSHVMAALLKKAHDAKQRGDPQIVLWGTGTPRRELLYVDDLAEACVLLLERRYAGGPLNVGPGEDHTIAELLAAACRAVGYEGGVLLDPTKPDGVPRKLLDCAKMRSLGWVPRVSLDEGLRRAYQAAPFGPGGAA
jgi:GDP-L-fucose synthase